MKNSKEIRYASTIKIEEFSSYVQVILEALGHPEAWVTDLSSVSDFLNRTTTLVKGIGTIIPLEKESFELEELATKLGLDQISPTELIWKIAERLKNEQ